MKKGAIIPVFIILLLLANVIVSSSQKTEVLPNQSKSFFGEYLQRSQGIKIYGNESFTQANGVVSGVGTKNEPFIIEGWDLESFDIRNTNAHFTVKNCYISGDWAVFLTNVENGKIKNCIIKNAGYWGIMLSNCNKVELNNLIFYNCKWPIRLENSKNNEIHNCVIFRPSWAFILRYENTYGNKIYHNDILYPAGMDVSLFNCNSNSFDDGVKGNFWHLTYEGTDKNGNGVGDDIHTFNEDNIDNKPLVKPLFVPDTPTIKGDKSGDAKEKISLTISSVDPQGEEVSFLIKWGDESKDHEYEWIGPYDSGENVIVSHKYSKKGKYSFTVYPKDINDIVGPYKKTTIDIKKTKSSIKSLLELMLGSFPILQRIIEQLVI